MLIKDPEQRISIEELIEVPIIQSAIDALLREFDGETLAELRKFLGDKDPSLKRPKSLEERVSHSLSQSKDLPSAVSHVDLHESGNPVQFVYLCDDKLYTETD